MKIERMVAIDNPDHFLMGDRIHVDHYTATCQQITRRGALFFFDQYLDRSMLMNARNTNRGGYDKSDLRKTLQSDDILQLFEDIRSYMIPFENGDLLRLPFAGEMFGANLPGWVQPDGHEQWPLMKDLHNRTASRRGRYEWGWLQNKDKTASARFCSVGYDGDVVGWAASGAIGIRPVFLIRQDEEGNRSVGSEKIENVAL